MMYLIDSADNKEIDLALSIGFGGVTANPSIYLKNSTTVSQYLLDNANKTSFITAEVMGSIEEMIEQVEALVKINNDVIIKLNFGIEELKLAKYLLEKNIRFAFTLIFTKQQALLAMQSGAEFIFYFFARNEDTGQNPYEVIKQIQEIIRINKINCQVIGASIRSAHHLNEATQVCDMVCIPFQMIEGQFQLVQTVVGKESFKNDFKF